MKSKNIPYFLILALVGYILFLLTCNDKPANNNKEIQKQNTILKSQVRTLEKEYSILSDLSDNLKVAYNDALKNQKNASESIKTKYITIYAPSQEDTTKKDTVECLPKIHVDSLINAQDSVNKIASKRFYADSLRIDNLLAQNGKKDTIIQNDSLIIADQKREIKKHKRKKWTFLGLGVISGFILGKF